MAKRLSRRDFARTSVAAGAAVTLSSTSSALADLTGPSAKVTSSSAASGAAAARRRALLPNLPAYGGYGAAGRQTLLSDAVTPAGQTPPAYPGGWKEGTTIPAEYYLEEKHYLNDERYLKDHFWFLVDHEKRIPKPGDFFLFQFGRGESVIITRDPSGTVRGFHNVCRHRGSRLCLHDEDLPSESGSGGKRPDANFSVVQLGSQGNTPVFRCPYHAWSYDLTGRLVSTPANGDAPGFDRAQHGLHPAHVRTMEGFIYVSFAENPPDFDTWMGIGGGAALRQLCEGCGTAQLKVAARRSLPTKANWKLVIENFIECYHCQPSHTNSYVRAYWHGDETLSPAQVKRIEDEIGGHGHEAGDFKEALRRRETGRDRLMGAASGAMAAGGTSASQQQSYLTQHWRPGYLTASLDGKHVAPLLPGVKERVHYPGVTGRAYTRRQGGSGFSTSGIIILDDYAFSYRFTPRDVRLTDVEMVYLVHPDAVEGKDYDVDHMLGLWFNTLREDRWVVENNHTGLCSGWYNRKGGQPYMLTEGGPAAFMRWYMRDVVPYGSSPSSNA